MPRLKALPSLLCSMPAAVALQRDPEGHSRAAEPWRAWYNTARWKALRIATFVRDLFTCQMDGCGKVQGNASLLVCDHIKPHRGDAGLFWDPANLQTLCKPCHDGEKQRRERVMERPL